MLRLWEFCGCWGVGEPENPDEAKTERTSDLQEKHEVSKETFKEPLTHLQTIC